MSLKIKRGTHGNNARSSIRRSIRKKLKKNTHQRLKDPTRFDAPDSDEEAWVDELFIKRATIIEVTRRVRNNLFRSREYVYKIHIQWNIGKTTAVYRSYDNFFTMQMRLLDFFGEDPDSPDRSIPVLPGRAIWTWGTRNLAMKDQPRIQAYIDELLDLPYKISRCNLVLDFFRFKETDPKEVMVTLPQELYRPPQNENILKRSFRRSFRKVKKTLVRSRSLRSMTDAERERENNANFDIEPTTASKPRVKVDKMAVLLQLTRTLGPTALMPPDMYDVMSGSYAHGSPY
ncbi:uncharacterized protein LOC134814164 isoform X1 [Bolinopsis microptera]|uniref:uncharacterized protein LOC134814164 isoform X1 n=1 Tax=Bolinopsis microptera TaxID=2820187 RepID=UPI003079B699